MRTRSEIDSTDIRDSLPVRVDAGRDLLPPLCCNIGRGGIMQQPAWPLRLRPAPFELRSLLERTAAAFAAPASARCLTLKVLVSAGLGEMVSDAHSLELITRNLLSNAIKFTYRGGVTLSAERVADLRPSKSAAPQRMVRVRVEDTGIGIEAQHLSALLQPSYQMGAAPHLRGAGLGLCTAHHLARMLGGEMTATSDVAKGSRFSVFLPLRSREVETVFAA
jgi:signal transduction histidine kinase